MDKKEKGAISNPSDSSSKSRKLSSEKFIIRYLWELKQTKGEEHLRELVNKASLSDPFNEPTSPSDLITSSGSASSPEAVSPPDIVTEESASSPEDGSPNHEAETQEPSDKRHFAPDLEEESCEGVKSDDLEMSTHSCSCEECYAHDDNLLINDSSELSNHLNDHLKKKRSKKKKKKKKYDRDKDDRSRVSTVRECCVYVKRLSKPDLRKYGVCSPFKVYGEETQGISTFLERHEDEPQRISPLLHCEKETQEETSLERLQVGTHKSIEKSGLSVGSDPFVRPDEIRATSTHALSPSHDGNGPNLSPRRKSRKLSPVKTSTEFSKENMPPSSRINLSRVDLSVTSVRTAETEVEGGKLSADGKRKEPDERRGVLYDKVGYVLEEMSDSCECDTISRVNDITAVPERRDIHRKKSKDGGEGAKSSEKGDLAKERKVKSKPGPQSSKRRKSVEGTTDGSKELNNKVLEKDLVPPEKELKRKKSVSSNGKTDVLAENGELPDFSSTTKEKINAVPKENKKSDGVARKNSTSLKVRDSEASRRETKDSEASGSEVTDSGNRNVEDHLSSKKDRISSYRKPVRNTTSSSARDSREESTSNIIGDFQSKKQSQLGKNSDAKDDNSKGKPVQKLTLSNILPRDGNSLHKKKPTDVNKNTFEKLNNCADFVFDRQVPPKHIKIRKKITEEKVGETECPRLQVDSLLESDRSNLAAHSDLISSDAKKVGPLENKKSLVDPDKTEVHREGTEGNKSPLEGVQEVDKIVSANFGKEIKSDMVTSKPVAVVESPLAVEIEAPSIRRPVPIFSSGDETNAKIGEIYSKAKPKSKKKKISNEKTNDAGGRKSDVPSCKKTSLTPQTDYTHADKDFIEENEKAQQNRATIPVNVSISKQDLTEPRPSGNSKRLHPEEEERLSVNVEHSKKAKRPSGFDKTVEIEGSLSTVSGNSKTGSSSGRSGPTGSTSPATSAATSVASSSNSLMPPPSNHGFKIPKATTPARSSPSSSRNQPSDSSTLGDSIRYPFTSGSRDFYNQDYLEANDVLDFEPDNETADDADALTIIYDPSNDTFFKDIFGEEEDKSQAGDKHRVPSDEEFSEDSDGRSLSPLSDRMDEVDKELEITVEGEDMDNKDYFSEGDSEDDPEENFEVQQSMSEGEILDENHVTTMNCEEADQKLQVVSAVEAESGTVSAETVVNSVRNEGRVPRTMSQNVRSVDSNAEHSNKRNQPSCNYETGHLEPALKRICTPSSKLRHISPETPTKESNAGTSSTSITEPAITRSATPSKRVTVSPTVSPPGVPIVNHRVSVTTPSKGVIMSTQDAFSVSSRFDVTTPHKGVTKSAQEAQCVTPRSETPNKIVTKSTQDARCVTPRSGTPIKNVTKSTQDAQYVTPRSGVATPSKSVTGTKSTEDAPTVNFISGVTTPTCSVAKTTQEAQCFFTPRSGVTTPNRSVTKSTQEAQIDNRRSGVTSSTIESVTKSTEDAQIVNPRLGVTELSPNQALGAGLTSNPESRFQNTRETLAERSNIATAENSTARRLNFQADFQVEQAEQRERSSSRKSSESVDSIERSRPVVKEWIASDSYRKIRDQFAMASYEERQASLMWNADQSNVSMNSTQALADDPSRTTPMAFKDFNSTAPAPLVAFEQQEPLDQEEILRDASTIKRHPILQNHCAKFLEDGRGNGYSCECREFNGQHAMLPFHWERKRKNLTSADHEQVWDLFLWLMNFDYWYKKEFFDFATFFYNCDSKTGVDYCKKICEELWKKNKFGLEDEKYWRVLIRKLCRLRHANLISSAVDEVLRYILARHPRNDQNDKKFCMLYTILCRQFVTCPKWPFVEGVASEYGLPVEIIRSVLEDISLNYKPPFLIGFTRWLSKEEDTSKIPSCEFNKLINALQTSDHNLKYLAVELMKKIQLDRTRGVSGGNAVGGSRSVTSSQSVNVWMHPSTQSQFNEDCALPGPSFAAHLRPMNIQNRLQSRSGNNGVDRPPSVQERSVSQPIFVNPDVKPSGLTSGDDRETIQERRLRRDSSNELEGPFSPERRLLSPVSSVSAERNVRAHERYLTNSDNNQLDRPIPALRRSVSPFNTSQAPVFSDDNVSDHEMDFSPVGRPPSARNCSVTPPKTPAVRKAESGERSNQEGRELDERARKETLPIPKVKTVGKKKADGQKCKRKKTDLETLIMNNRFGMVAARILEYQNLDPNGDIFSYEIWERLMKGVERKWDERNRTNVDSVAFVKGLLLAFYAKECRDGTPLINYRPVFLAMQEIFYDIFCHFLEKHDRTNAWEIYACAHHKKFDFVSKLNPKQALLYILELAGIHDHNEAARFLLENMHIIHEEAFRQSIVDVNALATEDEFQAEINSVVLRVKDIFRDSSVVETSIQILKRIEEDFRLKPNEETTTLLWNELNGYVDLFILMLLKQKSNEQAYDLYSWAKKKNIDLNQNTVRCLMHLLTDRRARDSLVSTEKEYSSAIAEVATTQIFNYKTYWTEDEIQLCFEDYLCRLFNEFHKTPSKGIRLRVNTNEEIPMPNDEEREFSVDWDFVDTDNIRHRLLSVLRTKFRPPFEVKEIGSIFSISDDQVENRRNAYQQRSTSISNHQRVQNNHTERSTPSGRSPRRCTNNMTTRLGTGNVPQYHTTTPQLAGPYNSNLAISDNTVHSSDNRPTFERISLFSPPRRHSPSTATLNRSRHSEPFGNLSVGSAQQDWYESLNREHSRSFNSISSRRSLERVFTRSDRGGEPSLPPRHYTTGRPFRPEMDNQRNGSFDANFQQPVYYDRDFSEFPPEFYPHRTHGHDNRRGHGRGIGFINRGGWHQPNSFGRNYNFDPYRHQRYM